MGVLCIFWIIKSLPSLPGEPSHQKQILSAYYNVGSDGRDDRHLYVLCRTVCFFTYIRPVYMNLAGFGVDGLTWCC